MENKTQDYVKVIMVYQIDSSFITQYLHTEGVSNFCDTQKPIRHVDFKSRRRNNKRNNNCFVFVKGKRIFRDPLDVER